MAAHESAIRPHIPPDVTHQVLVQTYDAQLHHSRARSNAEKAMLKKRVFPKGKKRAFLT